MTIDTEQHWPSKALRLAIRYGSRAPISVSDLMRKKAATIQVPVRHSPPAEHPGEGWLVVTNGSSK